LIDTILLVVIALALVIGVILLVTGKFWKHEVEKTPHGRSSNRVMIFEHPPDAKNELFKEAMIGHKHGIYLEKDFDEEIPTFFARPFLDYIKVDEDGDNEIFVCRLNKEGFQVITERDWLARFVGSPEVQVAYNERQEDLRLFKEEQGELRKKMERLSEETYLKEKEENVEKSLRDLGSRSLENITSEMRDEDFAESIYAKKNEPVPVNKQRRLPRIREEGDLNEESQTN